MSAQKSKPRSDSRLKTLSDERQAEIIELLKKKGFRKACAELAADGLRTSVGSLHEFYSWWHLDTQFKELEDDTITMQELLRKELPQLSEGQIAAYGTQYFNLRAIKIQDPKLFITIQTALHKAQMDKAKLELKREELKLNREKFRDSIKTNIEKGLDALHDEIKANPEALQLFQRLKAVVLKQVTA